MAIVTCALAGLLILLGLGALAMSLDLVPTEMGLLYGVSGVIFIASGAIVLAVAMLIARLDRIVAPKPRPEPEPVEAEPAPPYEVSRYMASGVEYALFSDGSIEAETADGPRRFRSMAEFRAYVETVATEAEAR